MIFTVLSDSTMADLLMKSATVELGAYAPRKLPYCWTPEQVRQILAALPALPAERALAVCPADGLIRKLVGPRRPAITPG